MTPAIRRGRLADAPQLAELLEQLDYPGAAAFIEHRIAQQLFHPDALLLVAEAGGRVAGFISLHFIPQLALPGDFCRISYLCVAQDCRSLGVGALLEQAAADEARARGCDRIELHCHQRRSAAHRFYARQGYRESPKYLAKPAAGS